MSAAGRMRLLSFSILFILGILLFPPALHAVNPDPDRDGLDEAAELLAGTDPWDADSDDDGMPDGWEESYGLDPMVYGATVDTDGDGLVDLGEYLLGCNPQSANSDGGIIDDGVEASGHELVVVVSDV